MKKFTALLLCVAMLMAGVVAQAEKGYEFIKYFLNDEEGGNLGYSSSMELTKTNTNKLVVVIFAFQTILFICLETIRLENMKELFGILNNLIS